MQATLLNALGQVVHTRTIALTAAGATAEFDTHALATGIYTLRLQAEAPRAPRGGGINTPCRERSRGSSRG